MMSECRTHLAYDINEDLCVLSREGTGRGTLILTREDRLNQGGKFV